jgi:FkbM family methyltransferase
MSFQRNLIFDVGLHKGEDTAFYLKKGFKVVSFEANRALVEECTARFSKEIASGQLTIIEGAIAPAEFGDTVTFYTSATQRNWGTILEQWEARNARYGIVSEKIVVPRIDILQVFEKIGVPYFLKIDIEGVDKHVLECVAKLPSRPQYISIESDKVSFGNLKSEFDILESMGYKKFRVIQQEDIPGTRITSTDLSGEKFEFEFEEDASGPFGDDIKQPWINRDQAIAKYRKIFFGYRLFGDASIFSGVPGWWRVKVAIRKFRPGPLPGWYDTHASL